MYRPTQNNATKTPFDAQGVAKTDESVAESRSQELSTIIDRLEDVARAEISALGQHQLADLSSFSRRKSQILLELTRQLRSIKLPIEDVQLNSRLRQLKATLDHNREALELHLKAARQLTDIIAHAKLDAESDGTYTVPVGRGQLSP